MNDRQKWNERYRSKDTPWESGQQHPEVERLFATYAKPQQKILEVGCGLGSNALWLARSGYRVMGVDFAQHAIEQARQTAFEQQLDIDYFAIDFMQASHHFVDFPIIFDCAVFHLLADKSQRASFVEKVAGACEDGGLWLNISCSTDQLADIARQTGVSPPPALAKQELLEVIEPKFEVLEMQPCQFTIDRQGQGRASFNAWASAFKKR